MRKKYNELLELLPNKTMDNIEIDIFCKNLFHKINYLGCYPSDKIPKMKNLDCCIVNNHQTGMPGEHWLAIIKNNNKIYIFDSFDRETEILSENFLKKWIETSKNNVTKQKIDETNCGARSILFLYFCDIYNIDDVINSI